MALARAFGCARVVFNDALRARETARAAGLPFIGLGELSKQLTAAKKTPERAWLTEVSSVVLQQSLRDLDTACKNFFGGLKGKRPTMGPPRFKSRGCLGTGPGPRSQLPPPRGCDSPWA